MLDNETYTICEVIGQGSGGVVYKAIHQRLNKYVVIKQLPDRFQHFIAFQQKRKQRHRRNAGLCTARAAWHSAFGNKARNTGRSPDRESKTVHR